MFRAAPKKGDCIVCQAPEDVRVAVNMAIWPQGTLRAIDYRVAGVRAAYQASLKFDDEVKARFRDLDPKTITRHADHIEDSWREVNPGERLADNELVVITDFAGYTEQGARLGSMAMSGLEQLIRNDPVVFAALNPKETIAIAKLGLTSVTAQETSRLKRRGQNIDVMAIFASSSGHVRPADAGQEEDVAAIDELRVEVAQQRALLAARATGG